MADVLVGPSLFGGSLPIMILFWLEFTQSKLVCEPIKGFKANMLPRPLLSRMFSLEQLGLFSIDFGFYDDMMAHLHPREFEEHRIFGTSEFEGWTVGPPINEPIEDTFVIDPFRLADMSIQPINNHRLE